MKGFRCRSRERERSRIKGMPRAGAQAVLREHASMASAQRGALCRAQRTGDPANVLTRSAAEPPWGPGEGVRGRGRPRRAAPPHRHFEIDSDDAGQ